jgi:hypothetical protein
MVDRLAGYQLESVLGSGGQGTVYLGVSSAGVKVAVKVPALATWVALRRHRAAAITLPILYGLVLVGGTINTMVIWRLKDVNPMVNLIYVAVVAAIMITGILLRERSLPFTVASILPAALMLAGLLVLLTEGGPIVLYTANATLLVWALWFTIRHRTLLRQTP